MKQDIPKKQDKETKELEKQIQELALTVDRVEDEKLELENQLKRALADYHNFLKNSEKRNDIQILQMKKKICESLIPSMDSIMMAEQSSKELKIDEDVRSWLNGILAILETLKKGMEEVGLKQYVPNKGDQFDNNIHEAVATIPQGENGKIFDIIQPGYILENIVIRPSRVVVSK